MAYVCRRSLSLIYSIYPLVALYLSSSNWVIWISVRISKGKEYVRIWKFETSDVSIVDGGETSLPDPRGRPYSRTWLEIYQLRPRNILYDCARKRHRNDICMNYVVLAMGYSPPCFNLVGEYFVNKIMSTCLGNPTWEQYK